MRISVSSDEINVLLYRYLLESGYAHTAFVFQAESHVHTSPENDARVFPGALIEMLEKGLLFSYVQSHMTDDAEVVVCNQPFSLLRMHKCGASAAKERRTPDATG